MGSGFSLTPVSAVQLSDAKPKDGVRLKPDPRTSARPQPPPWGRGFSLTPDFGQTAAAAVGSGFSLTQVSDFSRLTRKPKTGQAKA